MSREGSLDAPTRHDLPWREASWYDQAAIDKEIERVFDICHGCRRCFNLCDSFPKLFDLIDASPTGEVDGLDPTKDFKPVVDACTLCDMCFMTKCPYVPPHEFDLDFPHLMLRYRAAEHKRGETPGVVRQLAETDRNGALAKPVAPLVNLATGLGSGLRGLIEAAVGLDAEAELPRYSSITLVNWAEQTEALRDAAGPAAARKAVVYATCFANFNQPRTGRAALRVLGMFGVQTETLHPGCCGMPFLEHGDVARVAAQAETVAAAFAPWVADGFDVVSLTASCSLMLKFEWPLILPENDDVRRLASATKDINQYVVDLAREHGRPDGATPLEGGVAVHMACHARAQNLGPKAAEMLRLLPQTKVDVIERCSGHGGTFGVMKATRSMAVKVAQPAVRAVLKTDAQHLCSDCPLACKHLAQELRAKTGAAPAPKHPIELFAEAYGLMND